MNSPFSYCPFDDASGKQLLVFLAQNGITPEGTGFVLNNNTFLESENSAGSGTINLLKADASNNTILNALTGKAVHLQVNASDEFIVDGTNVTIGSNNLVLTAGNLSFGAASAHIIPGATSLLFRNHADSASNLAITDAGLVTVGVGNLELTAGNLVFDAASASIIPGATSLLFRNHANNATNFSIADAGLVTVGVGNLGLTAGNIVFTASATGILENTTAGSDTSILQFSGGGAFGDATRGAYLNLAGDDFSTAGSSGTAILSSSSKASADLILYAQSANGLVRIRRTTGGLDSWYFQNSNGDFLSDATNGGNVLINTVGKGLQVKSGSNAKAGTFTANGATPVVVANSSVTANSIIVYNLKTVGGTPAPVFTTTQTPGTSFTVNSTASNTSVYNYIIFDLI